MKDLHSNALKSFLSALIIGCLFLSGTTSLRAEEETAAPAEEKPRVSVSVDFLNQYIFRGVALSKHSAVIQPSITGSYKGFSLNVWGNIDSDDHTFDRNRATWNETDFTLSYSHELFIKDLNGTVGAVYYNVQDVLDSVEIFAGLSYASPWVTVGVTAYREVAHFPGWWLQFDLSRNFALPWYGMNVDLGASFGYLASEDLGTNPVGQDDEFNGLLAGQLTAALNVPVGKYFTISPRVGLAFPLSGHGADRIDGLSLDGQDTHVFGGIRLAASF